MKKAFFPGSFDPFNLAHLSIVCEILKNYDQVIIGVGNDLTKFHKFSMDERLEMVKKSIEDLVSIVSFYRAQANVFSATMRSAARKIKENPDCVKVVSYYGTAIDFALVNDADALIIGVKNILDQREEHYKCNLNRKICELRGKSCSTVCVSASMISHISSSTIRLLMEAGEYIIAKDYVTPSVHNMMCKVYLRDVYCKIYPISGSDYDALCKKFDKMYQRFSKIACSLNMLNIYRIYNPNHDMSSKIFDLVVLFNSLVIEEKFDDRMYEIVKANVTDIDDFVALCNAMHVPASDKLSKDTAVLRDICLNPFVYKGNASIDLWEKREQNRLAEVDEEIFLLNFLKFCDRYSADNQLFRTDYFRERYYSTASDKMKQMACVIRALLNK